MRKSTLRTFLFWDAVITFDRSFSFPMQSILYWAQWLCLLLIPVILAFIRVIISRSWLLHPKLSIRYLLLSFGLEVTFQAIHFVSDFSYFWSERNVLFFHLLRLFWESLYLISNLSERYFEILLDLNSLLLLLFKTLIDSGSNFFDSLFDFFDVGVKALFFFHSSEFLVIDLFTYYLPFSLSFLIVSSTFKRKWFLTSSPIIILDAYIIITVRCRIFMKEERFALLDFIEGSRWDQWFFLNVALSY